jgi:hypothetical protein
MRLNYARADFAFRVENPLSRDIFPGPALRGLLGWALAAIPSMAADEFFRHRFHPPQPVIPLWRLSFHEPPAPDGRSFIARVTTFGVSCEKDLGAVSAAFASEGLFLEVGTRNYRSGLHLHVIRPSDSGELAAPEESLIASSGRRRETVHFTSLLSIRTHGVVMCASRFNPMALFDSLRCRFAELAGGRIRSLATLPPCRVEEVGLSDMAIEAPLQQRRNLIEGVLGWVKLDGLNLGHVRWLAIAEVIGVGRATTFGAGTLQVASANRSHHEMV